MSGGLTQLISCDYLDIILANSVYRETVADILNNILKLKEIIISKSNLNNINLNKVLPRYKNSSKDFKFIIDNMFSVFTYSMKNLPKTLALELIDDTINSHTDKMKSIKNIGNWLDCPSGPIGPCGNVYKNESEKTIKKKERKLKLNNLGLNKQKNNKFNKKIMRKNNFKGRP